MFFLRRMQYRVFLNKLEAEAELTLEELAAISRVRRGFRHFHEFSSGVEAKIQTDGLEFSVQDFGDGKFLLWLWEHREELLAFILKIVEMFK